ncbi:hypothetical protein M0R45_031593 [Rubus argutus]|uniref:Secreted protein n=1 Tax=Rubus argutus TaxID=59490 RepID=A0AAW1WEQ9_RUBAR
MRTNSLFLSLLPASNPTSGHPCQNLLISSSFFPSLGSTRSSTKQSSAVSFAFNHRHCCNCIEPSPHNPPDHSLWSDPSSTQSCRTSPP